MSVVHNANAIEKLKQAAKIAATVLHKLVQRVEAGMSTADLDQLAKQYLKPFAAEPAFLGYQGFTGAICASVNNQVVHGIPATKTILNEGDLLSLDFGVKYKGYYGDCAVTVPVGKIDAASEALVMTAQDALYAGISAATPGNRVGDIGHAVEKVVRAKRYGLVKDFVGHGIGKQLHEEPQVPNFGEPKTGAQLLPGMVLAIEPMVNAGGHDETMVLDDGWTVVTKDGSRSAHVEHMVLITEKGPVILSEGLPLLSRKLAA